MRRLAILMASVLISTAGSPVAAETASILLDIQPSHMRNEYDERVYSTLLPLGGTALFLAKEASSGQEIWSSDGTVGGTMALRDVCPGACSSTPRYLGTVGNAALFFLETQESGAMTRLWRSDGTRPGTLPIGPERLQPCSQQDSAAMGRVLFFSAHTSPEGCELWRSDGTDAGTRRVKDIETEGYGSFPQNLTAAGGTLYFFANDSDGPGLWRSDGTEAGTALVWRPSGGLKYLTAVGSRLFFVGPDEGQELWTSDGTAAGTRPLTRFAAPSPFPLESPSSQQAPFFQVIDGVLYFLADDVTGGLDLWRSDGTAAGTRRVTNFGYAYPFPTKLQLLKLGSRLVLVANDGINGWRLWTSNGTPDSTKLLQGCAGGGCPTLEPDTPLVKMGQRVVFLGSRPGQGAAVWSSDGTAAGTRIVHNLCSSGCSSEPFGFTPLLGRAFFVAEGRGGNDELWQTDGSESGTRRIASLGPDPFPSDYGLPFRPVAVGERILFVARVPWDLSNQLWSSDGTPEGTGPVTRIGAGGLGSEPSQFIADGGSVWFEAHDEVDRGLWRSEGTAPTTVKVLETERQIVVTRGSLFVLGFEGGYTNLQRMDRLTGETLPLTSPGIGHVSHPVAFGPGVAFVVTGVDGSLSLWQSDGDPSGTRKLVDLPIDPELRLSLLSVLGPELFLQVENSSSFEQFLWRTDGTAAGTRQVPLGDVRFIRSDFVRLGNRVFFVASSRRGGDQIWKIEGPAGSPEPLLPASSSGGGDPSSLFEFRGSLYFLDRTEGYRIGLWKTDGTAAGTVLLRAFTSEWLRGESFGFTPLGDRLYFAIDDGEHGVELWRTDGTSAGTGLVEDIVPGRGSSYPSELAAAGGRLFFHANDGEHGFELWESDGTETGTRMMHDIAPGPPSSQPRDLTATGSHLFFSADDGERGREPWVLPLTGSAGCQPSDEVLCLGGGRFRVEVVWRDFGGPYREPRAGAGKAVPLTADTGWFWFYDAANVEVVVKVLDGQGRNGHHWIFYGALSNVEYALTVTDTWTGAARRYVNPPGRLGSVGDTHAFGPLGATSGLTLGPEAAAWEPLVEASRTAATAPCAPSPTRLCLQGGRFAVEARWRDFQNRTGAGQAVSLTSDTGWFWFFGPDNVEVVLKVLDGRPSNGKFWVFYGALSNVEYTLTVTDTQTGTVKTYRNPRGRLASVADTRAF